MSGRLPGATYVNVAAAAIDAANRHGPSNAGTRIRMAHSPLPYAIASMPACGQEESHGMNPPSGRFRTCVLLRPGVSYPWTCRTAIEDSRRGCAPRRRAGEPRVDTSPELEAPLARARREADRRAPDPGGESRECLAG